MFIVSIFWQGYWKFILIISFTVCPESVIIVGVMVSLQVIRRCYECQFISVYSDSKMNILHYIVGMTFYFGVGLSLIHDAPGFESNSGMYLYLKPIL